MFNRTIAVVAIVLAGAYIYSTTQITELDFGDPIGPRMFPYVIAGIMLIGAAMVLMESVAKHRETIPQGEPATIDEIADMPADRPGHVWMLAAVSGWVILYILVFERVGYVISTSVFIFGLVAYFNKGKWITNIAVSVLVSIGAYLLFHRLLSVGLPAGMLAF
jgi:putative tricarboxylic transport membrane protein